MSAFEDFIQVELPRRPWVATDPAQETVPVRRGAGPRQLDFVPLNDGQVLGKVGGVVQGVNIAGLGGGESYVHMQTTVAANWFIQHNKNSENYVLFILDNNGQQVFPDSVVTFDANTIEVDFNTPQLGKVVVIFAS